MNRKEIHEELENIDNFFENMEKQEQVKLVEKIYSSLKKGLGVQINTTRSSLVYVKDAKLEIETYTIFTAVQEVNKSEGLKRLRLFITASKLLNE